MVINMVYIPFVDEYEKAVKEAEKRIARLKEEKKKQIPKKAEAVEEEERPSEYEGDASAILWCELTTPMGTIYAKTDQFGHILEM